MAKEKNRELIDDIVDKMKAHELPYLEGAWEKFALNNTTFVSKKQLGWRYWSAAAALLFIASASFLYLRQMPDEGSPAVANIKVAEKIIEENADSDRTIGDAPALTSVKPNTNSATIESYTSVQGHVQANNNVENNNISVGHGLEIAIPVFHDHHQERDFVESVTTDSKEIVEVKKEAVKEKSYAANSIVNKNNETTRSVGEKLERLGSLFPTNSEKHDFASALRKWEVGAFVAPSSTVDKMGLGGGLSLAYQITDKISIRSGVSMQQYGAGANRENNLNAVQSASVSYNNAIAHNPVIKDNESLLLSKQVADKELSAVNNKLLTIDIPVDVRYHVTKSFYTSVGVSYVGVLDQTQENYFVNGINENAAVDNGRALSSPENMKQSFKGNAVNTKEFNGFVNFSIGKKMEVGKKLSIAVEPFVKLPVGGLKSTDLNYTNGGLKVVTSF